MANHAHKNKKCKKIKNKNKKEHTAVSEKFMIKNAGAPLIN